MYFCVIHVITLAEGKIMEKIKPSEMIRLLICMLFGCGAGNLILSLGMKAGINVWTCRILGIVGSGIIALVLAKAFAFKNEE